MSATEAVQLEFTADASGLYAAAGRKIAREIASAERVVAANPSVDLGHYLEQLRDPGAALSGFKATLFRLATDAPAGGFSSHYTTDPATGLPASATVTLVEPGPGALDALQSAHAALLAA